MEEVPNQDSSHSQNERPPLTEKQLEVVEGYTADFRLDYSDLIKPILDVGCGGGEFVRYLRGTVGNEGSYGLEIDESKVSEYADGVIAGDVMNIPFGDGDFDIVVARNFVSMFFDGKNRGDEIESSAVIQEMLRVIKPGGTLKFNAPTLEDEKAAHEVLVSEDPDINSEWLANREMGAQKLAEHLEELVNSGHQVDISEGLEGRTVFSITKPTE